MEYARGDKKVVKILINITFEKIVQFISKRLHINWKRNNILTSMKPTNVNSKRSIENVDYEDDECLIILSY